ncbi:hypothetical protein DH2020_006163 [Rehmannia glutinosa]|uniref:Protein kinase domain-containing protein n=1 Tax=Rehmannia glutinosa TaxID=99300 RepID=A0ABR0XI38_REHGL
MEQFKQIGEVVGSLNALMVFQNNIFNQRQCCLLVDMLTSGYKTIAEQMKQNLKFEEKNTKWKIIEHPLKELLRVFKEGEAYIRQCLEVKDFWAKAIALYQNADCVEFHIHNLLTTIPIVIEAIEMAGQISGYDQEEIQKKKFVYSNKYHKDMRDPRIFQWIFGDQYLVSQDFCNRLDSVWDEDRWFLLKKIKDKKNTGCLTSKRDHRLAESHSKTPTSAQNGQQLSFIWYAPEVLAEQENFENGGNSKYTEKSDVYSFGMICFELLTGKVPFEDAHLQGDKMSRNIRAGERPLFPFHSPKYITNLTKKCWHTDPSQRPSFSSICRVLRYTKRFLAMNPEHSQPDAPMPPIDFSDLEAGIVRSFPCMENLKVMQIPFQMFAYRVMERDRANTSQRDNSESGSDGASTCDEKVDDPFTSPTDRKSLPSPETMIRKLSLSKKTLEIKTGKQPGTPKGGRSVRPPHTPSGRAMRMNSEGQLMSMSMSPKTRRRSGHASDSELP